MKVTGLIRDEIYLKHHMGMDHPESPERLKVLYRMLDELGTTLNIAYIKARKATVEELCANHDPLYVDRIMGTAGIENVLIDPGMTACRNSWDAAIYAVGGTLQLVDEVLNGNIRNGFALYGPLDIMQKVVKLWVFAFSTMWRWPPTMLWKNTISKELL